MKRKIFNLFFAFAICIGLLAGFSVSALAVNLPAKPPVGYDKAGKYPAGRVQNVTYYSKETKSNRTMVVYTPPGYSANKKYPVIYAIHGINTKPSTIFDFWCVAAGTLADNLIGQGKIQPVIIVAMDNNNVNSHNELFNNVMPYAESHYPIIRDADHRGIYGYSMGGGVTFAEGMGNLDTFHHVCPSSATPFNHPSDKAMFTETAKRKIKTLVLSCGTIDWCGFYNANKASHDYCDSIGFNHYWLSVPGGDHNGEDVWRPAMYYFLQYAFPAKGATQPSNPSNPTKPSNPTTTTVPGETAKLSDGWYYI
ncbi:MAG: esterase family protein, partial [Clostridium sp.]|nr:esterase family protein [Clostridium sp.]